ncbi:hypothetical protein STTU_p0046 (plasmid) [Streptomyces sp. Tu6071]|nr:hypothetical protein STTU_p0046 [Streptomyces sp. Tu6071]
MGGGAGSGVLVVADGGGEQQSHDAGGEAPEAESEGEGVKAGHGAGSVICALDDTECGEIVFSE